MLKINSEFSLSYMNANELRSFIGKEIKLKGTVYKIRVMSGFAFIILKTGNMFLQCVYSEEFSRFPLSEIKNNMSVIIHGSVIKEERSRTGFEVRIIDFEMLSCAVSDMPVVINNKEIDTAIETLLDYRPITLRNMKEQAIFKIQAGICEGFRKFLSENKFTEIHTPKIVFSGAEGGANVFKLDYFGREAYLTQSPQFYKQIMAGVYERVYEIAPVFRAEKHDTSRHINEYTSVDLEMGFIESFYDICCLETKMLKETFEFLKEYYNDELALLKADVPVISEIPALNFTEAKEMISKTYSRKITDFEDFEPEEEKLLCEIIKKQTDCDFVFVTHYKSSKRPFYAMDSKENPEVTESFDLLFRGLEITTGGQRIHSYQTQVDKMERRGMHIEPFASYLMAHKYGLPPHGGLGLGLERFTAKLLGFQNVRYATMFPRDINRLEP
ncbi:MAG TPA: aspartate--tRNA(Asn) ligase [Clostridiales bacterium]|nr:aspartate--tRNA(Asn) ligase [Lachnospiraceae bacterium]HAQ40399.1 aspartate--tRNA(Asn) ligase [Clostridiales bacterium]